MASISSSGVEAPAVTPMRRAPSSHSGRSSAADSMWWVRGSMARAELREAGGVGAVAAADDHDDVDLVGQLAGGALALLGGVADGVEDEQLARHGRERGRERRQVGARLRRLHDDADAPAAQALERQPGGVLDDDRVRAGEALETDHLRVVALAQDHDGVAGLAQRGRLALGDGDERAGGVDHVEVRGRARGRSRPATRRACAR